MDLDGLQFWFDTNAGKSNNAFWSLKGDGKYRGSNLEISDSTTSWAQLERLIMGLNANGVRVFDITYKSTKNDPAKLTYTVKAPYVGDKSKGAIAGVGGIGEVMRMHTLLTESKLETIRAEHRADIERREAELKAKESKAELESRIWQLENEHKNSFEKWIEKIEESPRLQKFLQPLVSGFAHSIFTPVNIAGVPAGTAVPASTVSSVDNDTEEEEEGGLDFNAVVNGVITMKQAGIRNPEGKLYKIAYVAATNPELFADNYAKIEQAYNMLTSQNNITDE